MSSAASSAVTSEGAAPPHALFRRRYVWQWPIRIYHWVNVVCLTAMFWTGLYIANPVFVQSGEAYEHFVMGRFRQVHFAFAFLFFVNFLWRVYWFYMGNKYTRSGFPFVWRRSWWTDLRRQTGDYLKFDRGHIHLGHNALGGLAYTVFMILLGWAQIFTGFALFSESNPGGFWSYAAGWVIPLMGGSFQVRMWHHLLAWGFLVFGILHIYIVFYDGLQYRNGLVTSMVSGEKFYKEGDVDPDTWVS